MTTGKPSTASAPASTDSYASAYATLSAIADRLRGAGTAATVDGLVADVRAARKAYAACRGRLDAVRREIDTEIAAAEATATA